MPAALLALKTASQQYPDDAQARQRLAEMHLRLADAAAAQKEIDKAAERGLEPRLVELLNVKAALVRGEADVALAKFETNPALADDPALAALHADILARLGRIDAAFELYTQAAAEAHPPARALLGLARIHVARSEFEVARRYADEALRLDSRDPDLHMLDADLKSRRGDELGARKAIDEAARWNPYAIAPRLAHVRLSLNGKKFDDAGKRLEVLDKDFPNSPIVAYYKGVVAYLDEDYAGAENHFREVLSVVPNHALSQLYMGFLTYRAGNLEQAENFLQLYAQADPKYLPARKLLASILLKRRKPQEALTTLEDVGEDADADLLGLRASAYFAQGNTEAGLNTLQAAAKLAPKDGDLQSALVLAKTSLGYVDEAIALLAPETPIDKVMTRQDTMLLYALMTKRDWDKVIETGEKMHARVGDDPALLNALATAHIGKQDAPRAEAMLQRALEVSPETPTILRNLALLQLNSGEVDAAQAQIDKLLELDGNDAATLTLAGLAAALKRDFAAAVAFYERARTANPTAVEARLRLASEYVRMQNYSGAVEVAKEALALQPSSQAAMLNLGHGLRGLGDLPSAEKVARGALEAQPRSAKPHFLLGTILLEAGRVNEARQHLEQANALQPHNPDVLVTLTKAKIASGDTTASAATADEVAEIEGDTARSDGLRGDLASAAGDHAAAARHYESALAKDDRHGWAVNAAMALFKGGQGEEAVALLEARAAKQPKVAELQFFLGQIQAGLGRTEQAASSYERVLALEPDEIVALNNLALLELELGRDSAEAHAERAYALAPTDPGVADTYGWVLLSRGKVEAGMKALEAAATAAPHDGNIAFHYAVALTRKGNAAEAAKLLERALASGEFAARDAAEQLAAQLRR